MLIEYNLSKYESLDDVAKKYNVSVMDIKNYNNLTDDKLPKHILIPKSDSKVKVVANLNREFITTLDINNIKGNLSKIGLSCVNPTDKLKLFVPKQNNIYVVTVLDNLNTIAKKLGIEKSRLIELNNLKTEKLFIGQILKIC
ncbi:MAG TPA: hypothetical protein DD621_02965 [Clostridiales bacterium]|nr:hypothetical protein [Clostridiales bacterium]